MSASITDIPDEILVKIILYLNVRKRIPLAKVCTRFNSLVFEDKELLRDLDFSVKGRLVTASDIKQYFSNENGCKLVMKVNIENVNCMKSGQMLNGLIGRAINLRDLNIHGTKFEDINQLGSFLEPLLHLKRLSIDWPESWKINIPISRKALEKPFGKLIYLSANVCVSSKDFFPIVQLCDELEELRILATTPSNFGIRNASWNLEPDELRNLKIVQARGWQVIRTLKDHLIAIVPDCKKWTDFQLIDIFGDQGFYLEKNVQVCQELQRTKLMEAVPYSYQHKPFKCGWFLISECLLSEVIKITHEDVPEKFCCLTPCRTNSSLDIDEKACLLKIDEAKRLLCDPGYQISFLNFKHSIEIDCDAHLVASAFPNIKELVLSDITAKNEVYAVLSPRSTARRLRRKASTALEEDDQKSNLNSSFQMLIENMPLVEDLTIRARNICDYRYERWDLDALYLIPLWKNLTTLCLAYIRVEDGKFLIHIGKKSPQLEKIVLKHLGISIPCCYTNDLAEMLRLCKNLKEFSIIQSRINEMPELFTSLSNNLKLRSVRLISLALTYNSVNLISSVEQLLHSCPKLTTFVCIINPIPQKYTEKLTSALKRIKAELNRPNFQFQTRPRRPRHFACQDSCAESDVNIVYEDVSREFFISKLDGLNNEQDNESFNDYH